AGLLGRSSALVLLEVLYRGDECANDGLIGRALLQGADKVIDFGLAGHAREVERVVVGNQFLPVLIAAEQLEGDRLARSSAAELWQVGGQGCGIGRPAEHVLVDRVEPSRIIVAG